MENIEVSEQTYKLWKEKKKGFEEIVKKEVSNDELLEALFE